LPSQLVSIAPWDSVVSIQIDREIQNKTKAAAQLLLSSWMMAAVKRLFCLKDYFSFQRIGGRRARSGSGKFVQRWAQPIGL